MAVLRIQASGLPAIHLADSSKLRIGDLVLAIGNPFGIGQTVTMGIISAMGRANMGITDYEDFIQTDAAINPGNSGGALVNMAGELVGINTAIVSRSGGYQGIGFAIPSNMVIQVRDAIVKDGRVVRGWLGLAIQDLTEPLAETLKVEAKSGVLVSDVTPDGPGARAGLHRGDIITAIDGTRTQDASHLRNLVALAGKGKTVSVDLMRDGEKKTLSVELGELPGEAAVGASGSVDEKGGLFGGISVQELESASREHLHVPPGASGVLVTQVDPESNANHSGLRTDDVIVEINHRPTPDLHAYQQAVEAASGRALVLVLREGMTLFISLSP
jgi:serine protease Do